VYNVRSIKYNLPVDPKANDLEPPAEETCTKNIKVLDNTIIYNDVTPVHKISDGTSVSDFSGVSLGNTSLNIDKDISWKETTGTVPTSLARPSPPKNTQLPVKKQFRGVSSKSPPIVHQDKHTNGFTMSPAVDKKIKVGRPNFSSSRCSPPTPSSTSMAFLSKGPSMVKRAMSAPPLSTSSPQPASALLSTRLTLTATGNRFVKRTNGSAS
jgi:hypothetical protein